MNPLDLIKEIGVSGLLDMLVISVVLYSVLVWFRRTRVAFVALGMFITGGFYIAARLLGMSLTTAVLQAFFAVIVFVVIVIFQEEIRQFFEKVATPRLLRRFPFSKEPVPIPTEADILARTVQDLARRRIGAIIVVRGRELVQRHIEGGDALDGLISEPLLKSIFDPHSAGHDGAVVVDGHRVTHFGAHLPLSHNLAELEGVGTRHAAALGLSERADALCIVVSEERGTISAARQGKLFALPDAEGLVAVLSEFYREMTPARPAFLKELVRKNYREKLIALSVTPLLWFLLVHESKLVYRNFRVPIEYETPANVRVAEITPRDAEVTMLGPRRAFYFMAGGVIRVSVRLDGAQEGRVVKPISSVSSSLPEGVVVHEVNPKEVSVRLERVP